MQVGSCRFQFVAFSPFQAGCRRREPDARTSRAGTRPPAPNRLRNGKREVRGDGSATRDASRGRSRRDVSLLLPRLQRDRRCDDFGPEAIGPLGVAFGFGLGLALAITAFGHVSGGHFNPAVSAGLAIAGKFPSRDVIPYWVAQLVGGFGAVLVMAIVYSKAVTDSLDTNPGAGSTTGPRSCSRSSRPPSSSWSSSPSRPTSARPGKASWRRS